MIQKKIKLLVFIFFLLSFGHLSISAESDARNTKPLDGDLLLPEDQNKKAEDKKCITVCEQWGEDCIINPSRNSGARKCRRVCKSFAETCF